MIATGHPELDITQSHNCFPEGRSKFWISIGNYRIRETMQPKDFLKEQFSCVNCEGIVFRRQEVHPAWESTDNCSNGSEASVCSGKVCDKVYNNGSPPTIRERNWLRTTIRICTVIFLLLAEETTSTVWPNVTNLVFPIKKRPGDQESFEIRKDHIVSRHEQVVRCPWLELSAHRPCFPKLNFYFVFRNEG